MIFFIVIAVKPSDLTIPGSSHGGKATEDWPASILEVNAQSFIWHSRNVFAV
jgi:hypothetical protein